jgi:hypothetical protein
MKTLCKSERMKNVFKELPIVSYKRIKNIKDIQVTVADSGYLV